MPPQSSSLHRAVLVIAAIALIAFFHLHRYESEVHSRHRAELLRALNGTLTSLNYELRMMDRRHKGLDGSTVGGDWSGNGKKEAAAAAIFSSPHAAIISNAEGRNSTQLLLKKAQIHSGGATSPFPPSHRKGTMKALIFTMDSITAYEENSLHGGAAGELLIRRCLTTALQDLGVMVKTMKSDGEFEKIDAKSFDFIILDTWTWAAKGWIPKLCIRGMDSKIYILDFFGSEKLRGSGLVVPRERFLTAYGSPWNTFLGYFLLSTGVKERAARKRQGVVWGKDPKHLTGHVDMLRKLADDVHLVSTLGTPLFHHSNVEWRGHASASEWRPLLAESSFLIGLGDPLLGPSAIDCISLGCAYINPSYAKPVLGRGSQHDYAEKVIGAPHVCTYQMDDFLQAKACVDKALAANLSHFIPADFQKVAYYRRVKNIFNI